MASSKINKSIKLKKKGSQSKLTLFCKIVFILLVLIFIGIIANYFLTRPTQNIIKPIDKEPVSVAQPASDSIVTPPVNDQEPILPNPDTKPIKDPIYDSNIPNFYPIEKAVKQATAKSNYIVYSGIPKTKNYKSKFTVLNNIAFTVGYSEKRKDPIWVAYRIDETDNPKFFKRPSYFKSDDRTSARIRAKVYSRSGYDRGHMAPNKAIVSRYGRQAQLETFSMSNIVPQRPKLNRRVWKKLEGLEIKYSNKYKKIWVITGPIFDEHIEKIKERVEIPDKFFKILIDEKGRSIRTLQFIIPQNVKGNEPLDNFITSIDQIEKETDIDFFSPMSDKYEDSLESIIPDELWR